MITSHGYRSRCKTPLLVVTALCLSLSVGCRISPRHGLFLSTQVPALMFMQSQGGGSALGGHIYEFPALEAFSRSGSLVYKSHDSGRNVSLIRALPQSLDNLSVVSDHPDLSASLILLQTLRTSDRQALLDNHLPTVIAFSLAECKACTVQESVLTSEHARDIAEHGVNIVTVLVVQ